MYEDIHVIRHYSLRTIIQVRALGALSNDLILSAARDKTVRSWRRTSSNTFEPENTFRGHEHFVNSLAILPPTSTFPNGKRAYKKHMSRY